MGYRPAEVLSGGTSEYPSQLTMHPTVYHEKINNHTEIKFVIFFIDMIGDNQHFIHNNHRKSTIPAACILFQLTDRVHNGYIKLYI